MSVTAPRTNYVISVQLTALPNWLALERRARAAVIAEHAEPILQARPEVRVRWIDAEAFTAECSDLLLAETEDLRDWNHLFEALRDTPLFAEPYFALDRIVVGIEDGYRDYEQALLNPPTR